MPLPGRLLDRGGVDTRVSSPLGGGATVRRMRTIHALSFSSMLFTVACGSVVNPDPTGTGGAGTTTASSTSTDSASTTSTGATACVPGATMSCTCHAVSSPGVATCLADGSAYGPCTEQDGSTCACPTGRSDGCCPGDGLCCSCVQGCGPGQEFSQDPKIDALIACVCAAGVCADECKTECAGGGIGADCAPCVKKAGMAQCQTQYQACGGT